MLLSVVVPTFNEGANIGPLVSEVRQHLDVPHEVIVVDDASKDDTAANARAAGARVIVRKERGLATAVVRGIKEATGTYVVVMDADFQHPPEVVRRLLAKAEATGADMVVGSRYAKGGKEQGLNPFRKLISKGAGLIARIALPPVRRGGLTDPMSGLFLVRRDAVDPAVLRPSGYKILLEILGRCDIKRVDEVGYHFRDRREGESKLGGAVIWQYLAHLIPLAWAHPDNQRVLRFGLVGASGVLVNLGILWMLHGLFGIHDLLAVPIAVEASILSNWFLNDRFTFPDRRHSHVLTRLLKFNLVSLLALAVTWTTYFVLTRGFGTYYLLAQFVGIVLAFVVNYAVNLQWTYGDEDRVRLRDRLRRAAASLRDPEERRKVLAWLPFVFIVLGGGVLYFTDLDHPRDVTFDESYYVAVARQMDNGIWHDPCWENDINLSPRPLNWEHPPLAKLLIAGSTHQFDTDHAVFEGCRDPNNESSQTCRVVEHGRTVSTHESKKACFDAYMERARTQGNPYAWRMPSALMGTLTILFTGLAAGRLFGGALPAALAGLFVALDPLIYTSSRLAILDIFPTAFLTASVFLATFPTKKGLAGSALFLGLAFASKFYVLFAGPAVLAVALWSHWRAGKLSWPRTSGITAALVLSPPVVLALTYWKWWQIWLSEHSFGWAVHQFFRLQEEAIRYGAGGSGGSHGFHSPAYQWIPMLRPMWYYHRGPYGADSQYHEYMYAVGSPATWWPAALIILAFATACIVIVAAWFLSGRGVARGFRRLHPKTQALMVLSLGTVVLFLAFFLPDRDTFIFYATILVPFLALALAGALARLGASRETMGTVATGVVAVLALVWFAVVFPVIHADQITQEHYEDILITPIPWMDPCPGNGTGFDQVCPVEHNVWHRIDEQWLG